MLAVQNRKRKRLQQKTAQYDHHEDTNFDIVVKKTKQKCVKPKGMTVGQKNAKRKEKKKLDKIREQKLQKAERERILKSLEAHALPADQLRLFHSSCGKKPSVFLSKEQASRSAVIVSHKKKKKINTKLLKILNPTETKQVSSSEESSESELEDAKSAEESLEIVPNDSNPVVVQPSHQPVKEQPIPKTVPKKPVKVSVSAPKSSSTYVSVERDAALQEARLLLPILGEEQVVIEKITDNDIVVIVGATGSGKTTQVPQFLYEAGYGSAAIPGLIGVTEPRRVAAVTTCARVKAELNIPNVAYQIRYEGTVTEDTKIKFMTDGILLRELQSDFLLLKYCVVIIDEAHERSVNTDILIGMLSRVVPLRRKQNNPLKLVIMSATLRVTDFTENVTLFSDAPPVIDVGSRQHSVTLHHNKHTREDYVKEAYRKVCKIHRSLPPGDVLVFLTGVQEINRLTHLLQKTFPENLTAPQKRPKKTKDGHKKPAETNECKSVKLDRYDPYDNDNKDDDVVDDDAVDSENDDSSDDSDVETSAHDKSLPLLALPLYSALPPDRQQRVFNAHSDDHRLVIVATNVAETSLTIPGIGYVVDSGKVKTKDYCPVTGMSQFNVVWISHASAEQRAGRAGRTGPGHCYRLYSAAVMGNVMVEHTEPEISKKPIDGLVLQMKNLNIHRIMNFPFPTPPSLALLDAAENELLFLGLVEPGKTATKEVNKISELGKRCVNLPVAPRFAKLILLSLEQNVAQYALTIVSALSVGHLFTGPIPPPFKPRGGGTRLLGDVMVLLTAVGAWEHSGGSLEWSTTHNLRHRALVEIKQLRRQLTNIINATCTTNVILDPLLKPPGPKETVTLRKILSVCLGDHIAKLEDRQGSDKYSTELVDEKVELEKDSVLYGLHCEYLAFCSLEEHNGVKIKCVLVVEEEWLPTLLAQKCTFSGPLDQPPPAYCPIEGIMKCHRSSTFGLRSWVLPAACLPYPPGMNRFRHFAAALLEGQVIPALKHYEKAYLARPGILRKSWATLQPRAEAVLKQLVNKDVYSKAALLKMWSKDKNYLYHAFSLWIPHSLHEDLRAAWPPTPPLRNS